MPGKHAGFPAKQQRDYRYRLGSGGSDASEVASSPGVSQADSIYPSVDSALQSLGLSRSGTLAMLTYRGTVYHNDARMWALAHIGDLETCYQICAGTIRKYRRKGSIWPLWSWIVEVDSWDLGSSESKYKNRPSESYIRDTSSPEDFYKDRYLSGARNSSAEKWKDEGDTDQFLSVHPWGTPQPEKVRWIAQASDNNMQFTELPPGMPSYEAEARAFTVDTLFALARHVASTEPEADQGASSIRRARATAGASAH